MIIVMLHVFAAILAAILDLQTLYANGTYLIHSIVASATIRPKKYVLKWITNGVMAVFMFAAAILAAILNISISPRVPEWHEADYE